MSDVGGSQWEPMLDHHPELIEGPLLITRKGSERVGLYETRRIG